MTTFVEKIVNPDFKTVCQLLENYLLEVDHGDRTFKPKEFTDVVESWQCGLNQIADGDMEVKSHCVRFKGNSDANQDVRATLKIPNALFSSFLLEQKKAFLHWKNAIVNDKSVTNEEITKLFKQEDSGPRQAGNGKRNKHKKTSQALKA
eukprot:14720021-Ditylum_brightwellii.AAC.1